MPITFEEVTGEIVPERQPDSSGQAESAPSQPMNLAEELRHELALIRERSARLKAD